MSVRYGENNLNKSAMMLLKGFVYIICILQVFIKESFSNKTLNAKNLCTGNSILKSSTGLPNVFLKRNKRFLIFEEGATAVATVNMAKAIIDTTPRGLAYVNEYSLYYDLPHDIEMALLHKIHRKPTTTATTTTTTTHTPWHYDAWDNWQPTLSSFPHDNNLYLPQAAKKWQNFQYSASKSKWQKTHGIRQNWPHSQQKWQQKTNSINRKIAAKKACLPKYIFGIRALQRREKWCAKQALQRSKIAMPHRRQRSILSAKAKDMFFDLIEMWAKIHSFNGRHCAMRTLCEARQLLLPKGQSLFHDILHILINFSTPRLQEDEKLRRALLLHENPAACANLYGPHCRVSFLQHFTREIHGKFM